MKDVSPIFDFSFTGNNTIALLYDGLGNKLRKTVKTNGSVSLVQDYLGGIELKNNQIEAVYNEEGRALNTGSGYRYEYVLCGITWATRASCSPTRMVMGVLTTRSY